MEMTYLHKQILSAAGLLTAIGISATQEMIERVIKLREKP
jgi:ABC-type enterochelin transport system permease subunit